MIQSLRSSVLYRLRRGILYVGEATTCISTSIRNIHINLTAPEQDVCYDVETANMIVGYGDQKISYSLTKLVRRI